MKLPHIPSIEQRWRRRVLLVPVLALAVPLITVLAVVEVVLSRLYSAFVNRAIPDVRAALAEIARLVRNGVKAW